VIEGCTGVLMLCVQVKPQILVTVPVSKGFTGPHETTATPPNPQPSAGQRRSSPQAEGGNLEKDHRRGRARSCREQ